MCAINDNEIDVPLLQTYLPFSLNRFVYRSLFWILSIYPDHNSGHRRCQNFSFSSVAFKKFRYTVTVSVLLANFKLECLLTISTLYGLHIWAHEPQRCFVSMKSATLFEIKSLRMFWWGSFTCCMTSFELYAWCKLYFFEAKMIFYRASFTILPLHPKLPDTALPLFE